MGIIGNSIQKQIDKSNTQQYFQSVGTVLDYDLATNTAEIRFSNPNGEGSLTRKNVRLSSTLGGNTNSGLYPGCKCLIHFINGNIWNPIITGVIDNFYDSKTCSDQGSCLVNPEIKQIEFPENFVAMSEDWTDYNNQDESKYINDFGDYSSQDITEQAHEMINELDKYSATEQGMTNLKTKSTIKLCDNGDIDMFVANNIGIRISKKNHRIYFYGWDINLNGEYDLLEIIEQYKCKCEEKNKDGIDIKNLMTIIKLNDIIKNIDYCVEELEKCIALSIYMNGNSGKFVQIRSQIESFKRLRKDFYDNATTSNYQSYYDKFIKYVDIFEKELNDAAGILEV